MLSPVGVLSPGQWLVGAVAIDAVLAEQARHLSVDIRCDVLPPYLRYRRVFANLSEVPPVALFR